MNADQCAQLCSKVCSLAAEYKACCRNGDQLVCIEACARLCHACCNCAVVGLLDENMMTKLHATCTWCNKLCRKLHVGKHRECCVEFHKCCSDIVKMCQPSYRGTGRAASMVFKETQMENIRQCCRNLLEKGCVQKPYMLKEELLTHKQLCVCEACLKLCDCVCFFACNTCENLDPGILQSFKKLCQKCREFNFCAAEVTMCMEACDDCGCGGQQYNTVDKQLVEYERHQGHPDMRLILSMLQR